MVNWEFLEHVYFKYAILITIVLIASLIASKILRGVTKRMMKISSQSMNVDPTNYHFLANGVSTIVFVVALIIIFNIIPELHQFGVTLFAGAGILTVIVGFASQQAFSNIVSGIFIVIFKPFRVHDIVEIGTFLGKIEDITLRHTVINSFENKRIIFPNSIISSEIITNWSIQERKVCQFIHIGISYDSDIDLARKIIQEEIEKHPHNIDNRTAADKKNGSPRVVVRLINHGDSSIDLRAYGWATDPEKEIIMKCDILESVKKRFDKEGISIPFPHRTVYMRGNS